MNSFLEKHAAKITGVLECFDRVILRGHLPMASAAYFSTWLRSKRIALNLQHPGDGNGDALSIVAAPWFWYYSGRKRGRS